MLALSIRQPFAEEILRGIKRVEYRPKITHQLGERFYIYASLKEPSPEDLWQFSALFKTVDALRKADLPRGVIVGTAVIHTVTPPTADTPYYHWHLEGVQRLAEPIKPKGHPQPTWFRPF